MSERNPLFVLAVTPDRVIAATLATVLHAGGYMAATTASDAMVRRIAERMIIDAAVLDLAANRPLNLDAAVVLRNKYPDCRIILICSQSQFDEAAMLAEDAGLECDFLVRPLSRADLLARLALAPGVRSRYQVYRTQLEAA